MRASLICSCGRCPLPLKSRAGAAWLAGCRKKFMFCVKEKQEQLTNFVMYTFWFRINVIAYWLYIHMFSSRYFRSCNQRRRML